VPERILVACNSTLPAAGLLRRQVAWADHVVGADGGADRLLAAGHRVDAIVGDMDSVSAEARAAAPSGALHRIDDPDTTDLDKCLAYAAGLKAREVRVVGATAGRLDHTVGSLASLTKADASLHVVLVDDGFDTWLVRGVARFSAPAGTVVSLLAPGGATGVTTRGLRWPLTDAELGFSTLGVHNEVAANDVEVSVAAGDLFVMRGRFVEAHR
jgi:thiamine pyrophosphokinase